MDMLRMIGVRTSVWLRPDCASVELQVIYHELLARRNAARPMTGQRLVHIENERHGRAMTEPAHAFLRDRVRDGFREGETSDSTIALLCPEDESPGGYSRQLPKVSGHEEHYRRVEPRNCTRLEQPE